MEQADLIIENGFILTMDAQARAVPGGRVCVRGGRIVHVGAAEESRWQSPEVIDARGGMVLPGLVNAHTHAAMTLFRGLADDLPLMEWLEHYIFPVERRMDADFVYTGTLLACAEMILSGTTTFCDMYLFETQAAQAAAEAGMRCLVGEVLYDFPSPNYGPVEEGLAYTEALIKAWQEHPLVSVAVEPHALFTCSPNLLEKAGQMAARYGVPLVMHVAETAHEVAQVKERYGRSPVRHLEALGLLGPHLIADHCVHLEPEEMDLLAAYDVKVVHNPESNMKLASGIAPVPELLERGVCVALGTDGCASNNNLDLFSEMDTAAKLHKVYRGDPTVMEAYEVVKMATLQGARALGLGQEIGSIETGKRADIIVVATDTPHLTPLYNPYSHLVYAAKGADVTHAIIDGRVVMAERRLRTLDLEAILARVRDKAQAAAGWVGLGAR